MTYDDVLIKQKTYSKQDVQKLIDYFNQIAVTTYDGNYKGTFKTREEYMAWVAESIRMAGFPTEKIGSSWGVLK